MTDLSVERGFVDVAEGQIHYRTCGADGSPVLIMVHGSPGGSRPLIPLMKELGGTFKIYAPDTLGNADSSPAASDEVDIALLANGLLRAIDGLGVERFYLWGTHTGGNLSIEASIAAPDRVRRMILDGVGLYAPDEQAAMLANHAPAITPDAQGSQFNWAWHFTRDAHAFWPWWRRTKAAARKGGMPSDEALHLQTMDVLKSIRTYHLSYRASLAYDKRARLPLITVPTMVAAAADDVLAEYTEEAANLVPGGVLGHIGDAATAEGRRKTAAVYTDFLLA
jgi:pimeloyl-ACP methyl ester carboxylesterase